MEHIIIIGAGTAGLLAGCRLVEKNYHVTIVEARDRVGGRIHTLTNRGFSMPAEAGAEFVHGDQPLTMDLLRRIGVETIPLKGKSYTVFENDLSKDEGSNEHWPAMMDALNALAKDTTIGEFLDANFSDEKYNDLRANVKGFVEGYDAADIYKASAFALREEWEHADDEEQYHIKGGYHVLIEHLLQEFTKRGGNLLKNFQVREVKWQKGKVVVGADKTQLQGDKLVITVPVGVLQNQKIRFEPKLKSKEQLWQQCGYGGVIKCLFEFKTSFWQETGRKMSKVSFIFSDAPIPTWWTQQPSDIPLLTGWWGGPSTQERISSQEIYERAIKSLSYIFKLSEVEITGQIKAHHVVNWLQDEYAMGAYAFPTVVSYAAGEELMAPVSNTLFFAGEGFYTGPAMGTVEAALSTAEDAVKSIISASKKSIVL